MPRDPHPSASAHVAEHVPSSTPHSRVTYTLVAPMKASTRRETWGRKVFWLCVHCLPSASLPDSLEATCVSLYPVLEFGSSITSHPTSITVSAGGQMGGSKVTAHCQAANNLHARPHAASSLPFVSKRMRGH